MGNDNRTRWFQAIAYPESLPLDWAARLDRLHWQFCYILHDKDVYTEDDELNGHEVGELKKPHYHIRFYFAGKKSVESISVSLMAAGIEKGFKYYSENGLNNHLVEKIDNVEGAIQYLTHQNNPDKFQYSYNDIITFGGLDIARYFEFSLTIKKRIFLEIITYVIENEVIFFADLLEYSLLNNSEWFEYLRCESYAVKEFIRSRQERNKWVIKNKATSGDISELAKII